MKKRVAIFMHGGLGGGHSTQGLPMIQLIVEKLSIEFEITVFSLAPFNKNFHPSGYRAYCVPTIIKRSFFRWLYFVLLVTLKSRGGKKFDVFYSFWGYPMGTLVILLSKFFFLPSVINILGSETARVQEINYGYLLKSHTRFLSLWTCRNATHLIAVSQTQINTLNLYGIKRNIHLIPWGADPKLFSPVWRKPGTPLQLIHVANQTPVKDQITLIKGFDLILKEIDATLTIIGPDYLNGRLQQLVFDLGITNKTYFTGFVNYHDISKFYHNADAFILTSLAEGQNSSITEAMMCGLLPISTPVGIMDPVFGERVGIVFPFKDFQSLADEVLKLYKDQNTWIEKTKAAHAWASQHDLNWTITNLASVINDASLKSFQ